MAESGQAKKHPAEAGQVVICSDGTVAGTGCKTLACASKVLVQCEHGRNLPCSYLLVIPARSRITTEAQAIPKAAGM